MTEADLDRVVQIENAAFSHPWSRNLFADGLKSYDCWLMFDGDEQIGHGIIQMCLFPFEQVTARGGLEPMVQTYNLIAHEPACVARLC